MSHSGAGRGGSLTRLRRGCGGDEAGGEAGAAVDEVEGCGRAHLGDRDSFPDGGRAGCQDPEAGWEVAPEGAGAGAGRWSPWPCSCRPGVDAVSRGVARGEQGRGSRWESEEWGIPARKSVFRLQQRGGWVGAAAGMPGPRTA